MENKHIRYLAIDPMQCKDCKAVFCKNCTEGECVDLECQDESKVCALKKNRCPNCNTLLKSGRKWKKDPDDVEEENPALPEWPVNRPD